MKEDGALWLNLAKAAHYCSTKKMHLKKKYIKEIKKANNKNIHTNFEKPYFRSMPAISWLSSFTCTEKKDTFDGHLKLN